MSLVKILLLKVQKLMCCKKKVPSIVKGGVIGYGNNKSGEKIIFEKQNTKPCA
jgi:hypothetical protein